MAETVHPHKILLLEDHTDSRRLLLLWLRYRGYEVVETKTVAEAIAALDGQAMALLDLNLPDGSGVEVLQRIRQQPHKTRVAFLTAQYELTAVQAMLAAADAIFRKPVDLQQLMDWITAHGRAVPLDPNPDARPPD